jgi:exodeoxyribonuclease VII large subunit
VRRNLEARLRRFEIRPRLAADRRRMETAHALAAETIRRRLAFRRAALEQVAAKLGQLSPLRILERGYAIVSNPSGILKDSDAAPPGSPILVRLARGTLDAVVSAPHPQPEGTSST